MSASPRPIRGAGAVVALVLSGPLALAGPASAEEGPGYGGTADALAVSWTESDVTLRAMGEDVIELTGGSLSLDVFGLGFRGRSEVSVAVGTSDPVEARVDPTGTLDLSVDVQRFSAGPEPGTSVVVIGRAPAGTTRTLVGAVPPLPSGTGPADLIPWVVGGGLTAAVAASWRRRRALRPHLD